MYYIIFKHGTYLTDKTNFTSTWEEKESRAMKFWDKTTAMIMGEDLDANVIPCVALS